MLVSSAFGGQTSSSTHPDPHGPTDGRHMRMLPKEFEADNPARHRGAPHGAREVGDRLAGVRRQALSRLLQRLGLRDDPETGRAAGGDGGQRGPRQDVPPPGGLVHYRHAARTDRG